MRKLRCVTSSYQEQERFHLICSSATMKRQRVQEKVKKKEMGTTSKEQEESRLTMMNIKKQQLKLWERSLKRQASLKTKH